MPGVGRWEETTEGQVLRALETVVWSSGEWCRRGGDGRTGVGMLQPRDRCAQRARSLGSDCRRVWRVGEWGSGVGCLPWKQMAAVRT